MALSTEQKAKNALHKLYSRYGDCLPPLMDEVVFERNDQHRYDEVFATAKDADGWFYEFCRAYDLTAVPCQHYSNRVMVEEWLDDDYFGKPYFCLWKQEDDDSNRSHIELGASLQELWLQKGALSKLEQQMIKIIDLRKGGA